MQIWDQYGNWDEIAKLSGIEIVKQKIKGNNNVWYPNFCSTSLQYIFGYVAEEAKTRTGGNAVAIDFGCGLGRNGPLLRRFFPRVVGVDIPDMIDRLRSELPTLTASLYDGLYTSPEVITHPLRRSAL